MLRTVTIVGVSRGAWEAGRKINDESSSSNWGRNSRNELVLYVENSEKKQETNNNVKKARILRLCLTNCK